MWGSNKWYKHKKGNGLIRTKCKKQSASNYLRIILLIILLFYIINVSVSFRTL